MTTLKIVYVFTRVLVGMAALAYSLLLMFGVVSVPSQLLIAIVALYAFGIAIGNDGYEDGMKWFSQDN